MKVTFPIFLSALALFGWRPGLAQEAISPPAGPPVEGQSPGAQEPAPMPAPALSPEASFFHDQLALYGQWFWLEPYGWVWTPANVGVGWRPYTEGNWAYTDGGWTWVSDVPWGWAPFHYGRLAFHEQRGWRWVPGSEWARATLQV